MPLFLAFPLLLAPVAAGLVGPRTSPRVVLDGTVGGSDRSVRLDIRLTPPVDVRPESLDVRYPVPAGVEEVHPPVVGRDGPSLRVQLDWRLPEPTLLTVPTPTVTWKDPLGLVERSTVLEAPRLYIERYPPELQRAGAVRLRRTLALPGETRSRAVGEAGEFFGIRDAAPGDPPRRINWRASARAGRRLANEYALDRTGDLVILLDTRPTNLGPDVDGRLLAVSRGAAFGLAEAFLRDKSRVGVATYGEFLHAVPLASGRTQRFRIRELLLRTELSTAPGPAERCAVALRRYYPAQTTTVVLSPLASETQHHLVAHVRRRGFPTVVLSPSYLAVQSVEALASPEDEALAQRYTRLRRREEVTRMWQDAPVVDWEEFWSLAGFVHFLRRPSVRERGVA